MSTEESTSGPNVLQVFDRRAGGLVPEPVLGDRLLRLAYLSPLRPLFGLLLFRNAWPSRLMGWFCNHPLSRRRIGRTISELGIDEREFAQPASSYGTFNEFFHRKLHATARPFEPAPQVFCSPADARLTVHPRVDGAVCIPVKGANIAIPELLAGPDGIDPALFDNGTVLVARLCPADYHRFHYPAAGRTVRRWEVSGRYDSVNPLALALGVPVFTHNWRVVSILEHERFGTAAFIEVGAFGVAGIVQTHAADEFQKMDEKGYFTFGGSTLIIVLRAGRLAVDPDLVERSRAGVETLVRAGERLGLATEATPT